MQNKAPLFSIITVCLNEPGLEKTCKSIVEQSFQDFEWIVIDGGSDKKTLDIFEKYKCRMNYFVSEKDDGIYYAMNKGIKKATGEWLNFMNAGDSFVSVEILSKVATDAKIFSCYDVLYGHVLREYLSGTFPVIMPSEEKLNMEYFFSHSLYQTAMFYKRSLFDKYNKFDTAYRIVSDLINQIVLYQAGVGFKCLDYIISIFLDGGISSSEELLLVERDEIINKFFTEAEIEIYKKTGCMKRKKTLIEGLRYKIK